VSWSIVTFCLGLLAGLLLAIGASRVFELVGLAAAAESGEGCAAECSQYVRVREHCAVARADREDSGCQQRPSYHAAKLVGKLFRKTLWIWCI
jgi:hypothetical protein